MDDQSKQMQALIKFVGGHPTWTPDYAEFFSDFLSWNYATNADAVVYIASIQRVALSRPACIARFVATKPKYVEIVAAAEVAASCRPKSSRVTG